MSVGMNDFYVIILSILVGKLCCATNLIFAAGFALRGVTYFLHFHLGFLFLLIQDLISGAIPLVEDHDVQMMNLYWKLSTYPFQSTGI